MPSETPSMPHDTHQHMLRRGGNKHMPIQAYEVAWNGKTNWGLTIVRWIVVALVLTIALFVSAYR